MKNYCTLGDSKYLPHLVCLISSILKNFKHEYTIHVLSLDEKTHKILSNKFSKDKVKIYSLDELQENFEIKAIRFLPAGNEAISNATSSNKDPQFVQFCWALAPHFSEWIMKKTMQSVAYVDADIVFYRDMDQFYSELGNKSIGFVRHRIDYLYTSGEFNVGIVYFNYDGPGRSALKFWCDVMKNPNNPYSLGYGTCGDQKYLEAIHSIFREDVAIVDKKFGHLAPWNVTFHGYKNNKIIWENIEQDLTYFHFAHFVWDENGYKGSYKNEWIWGEPVNFDPFVKKLYDDYYFSMLAAQKEMI